MNAVSLPARPSLFPGIGRARASVRAPVASAWTVAARLAADQKIDTTGPRSSVVMVDRDAGGDTRWAQSFRTTSTAHVLEAFSFGLYHHGIAGHSFIACIVKVKSPHRNGWLEFGAVAVETLWTSTVRTERLGYWREKFVTGDLELEPEEVYWAVLTVCDPNTSFAMEYHVAGDPHYGYYPGGELIHWQISPDGQHYIQDFDGTFASSFTADFRSSTGPAR